MVFQISADMQATYKFIFKDLFALILMNLPSTYSWKHKIQLSLSHIKAFLPITISALGECCSFHPEGQLKFALYPLLFVMIICF